MSAFELWGQPVNDGDASVANTSAPWTAWPVACRGVDRSLRCCRRSSTRESSRLADRPVLLFHDAALADEVVAALQQLQRPPDFSAVVELNGVRLAEDLEERRVDEIAHRNPVDPEVHFFDGVSHFVYAYNVLCGPSAQRFAAGSTSISASS